MKLFREKGRLIEYEERPKQNIEAQVEWGKFMKKGSRNSEMVEQQRPDIIQLLNEKTRNEKERARQKAEKEEETERLRTETRNEEGGEWIFNQEYSEYYWVGEREPVVEQMEPYKPLSKELLQRIKKQEDEWIEAMIEERKKEAKEKRKPKNERQKAAMKEPMNPPPETEIYAYKRIRINNIREREQAMAESGVFNDLHDYKKEIGLLK